MQYTSERDDKDQYPFYKIWTGEGDFATETFSIAFKGNYPGDNWHLNIHPFPYSDKTTDGSSMA